MNWNFNKKQEPIEEIAAIRISFLEPDSENYIPPNDLYIKIPHGGRCTYAPSVRVFTVLDSDEDVVRTVQAPFDISLDIVGINKDYLEFLESTQQIADKKTN